MSFLFVDRILELTPGKKTVGVKKVTLNDIYLTRGIQHELALLPCVIGEALGQLCSWNVLKTTDFQFRPVGGVVQEIQIMNDAAVGDTVLLESEIDSLDTENHLVNFSGRASFQDKTILIVKNSLAPLLPLENFNHLSQVQNDFNRLVQSEFFSSPSEEHYPINEKIFHVAYDKILSLKKGTEIIAEKTVSPDALYFATHFPKKPVMPLSLLMEYNLQLANLLITDLMEIPVGKNLRVTTVKKVKISNFVLPGDQVTTRITLKERNENQFVMNFHNEVNNKRVCVAESEFRIV